MFSFVCTCGGTPYQCIGSGGSVINWPFGPRSQNLNFGSADQDLYEIFESFFEEKKFLWPQNKNVLVVSGNGSRSVINLSPETIKKLSLYRAVFSTFLEKS